MTKLFRGMKENAVGEPEIGSSARKLGVRPGIDLPVSTAGIVVGPGQGGMSVSPDDPMYLPEHRRPPEFRGDGRDLIWTIGEGHLGEKLRYRPDPSTPRHGFVEPANAMPIEEYQHALAETRESWRKIEEWPE